MSESHERTSGPWRSLAIPRIYSKFQRGLAVSGSRAQMAELYIRAKEDDSILDLGCGPADTLEYLPPVEYLGIDLSAKYLAEARRRYEGRPRTRFVQMDVRSLWPEDEQFDIVLAQGLLHHFNDEQSEALLKTVARLMKPDARLVTVDPARTAGQHLIARLLASTDRGRFVRTPHDHEVLVRRVFSRVIVHVRHDLMRLPYTHLFSECSEPRW